MAEGVARASARRPDRRDAVGSEGRADAGRRSGPAVSAALGIDRSGPRPRARRGTGQPLRPFTLPNLVGYLRLASIPVFLVLAFDSGDGRSTPAALLYLWITLGDFLDGFLARATGQYSRMGALLDPIVDRLSGARRRRRLLALRAAAALGDRPRGGPRGGDARPRRVRAAAGVDLEINWIGRIGVAAGLRRHLLVAWSSTGGSPTRCSSPASRSAVAATVVYVRTAGPRAPPAISASGVATVNLNLTFADPPIIVRVADLAPNRRDENFMRRTTRRFPTWAR